MLRHVELERSRLVAYVAGTPLVVFAGGTALVLFLLAGSRIGTALAGVCTVLLLLTQAPLYLGTASEPPGSTPLVVMTLNMFYGGADPDAVVAAVREHDVDVLTTIELTADGAAALRSAGVADVLPHAELRPADDQSGNGVWSRLPLTAIDAPDGFDHPPVAVRLDDRGRSILVAAVHPRSPFPDDAAGWSAEMGRLAAWLEEVEGLAVVAGDFNATRDHQQFRSLLDTGFEDAAAQAGVGWQPTYPANRRRIPQLIAIDHVLVSGGIVAGDLVRVNIPGTDHAALVGTLAVPPAGDGG